MGDMRILHVTESLNAGVFEVIKKLANSTNEYENYLLWASHTDTPEPDLQKINIPSNNVINWIGNPLVKTIKYKLLVKKLAPDIVHVHSSKAGLYCRIFVGKEKIAYSSHGYS